MMPAKKATKPKPNSLIEDARKSAGQYSRKVGHETWFDKLQIQAPLMASELKTLCVDWHSGGEMRDMFRRKADLHRFVCDKVIKVGRFAFERWLDEVVSS